MSFFKKTIFKEKKIKKEGAPDSLSSNLAHLDFTDLRQYRFRRLR